MRSKKNEKTTSQEQQQQMTALFLNMDKKRIPISVANNNHP